MGTRQKGAFICLFELSALGGKMSMFERKRVRHFSEMSRSLGQLADGERNMKSRLPPVSEPLIKLINLIPQILQV